MLKTDLSSEAEGSKKLPVSYYIHSKQFPIILVLYTVFRSCADGLAPPFFAQMGPSVLDNNVFLKNVGSGIKWESLEEQEFQVKVESSSECEVPQNNSNSNRDVYGRMATRMANTREVACGREAVRCGALFAPWRTPPTAPWPPRCLAPPHPYSAP